MSKLTELSTASTLTGSELVYVVQSGADRSTTLQSILALAPSKAPTDGKAYVSKNGAWIDLSTLAPSLAPTDGKSYVSKNNAWIDLSTVAASVAPSDGNAYVSKNGSWVNLSTLLPAPTLSSYSYTFPSIAAGQTYSTTLNSLPVFSDQSVIFFVISMSVTATTSYTFELVEVDSSNNESVVYQSATQTTSFKDTQPFTFDRMNIANTLVLRIINSSSSAITGASVRMVMAGV
ncbi:hypothetical protein RsoM2USA_410 [Ralstonia phage RsoM2USA]|nr:hypothetical protein RsoM2USA_410 [Ralstonia phage RsoM2USA]